MGVIRLAITAIVFGLVLLIGVLVHVVTWVVGRWDPDLCLRMRSGYLHYGTKLIWLVGGGPTKVSGTENIPTDRPVLFVANHRSLLDIVLCLSLIPVPVGFIAKIELEKIPLLRMQMRDINCLFLDRKDNKQGLKVILKAIEQVKGGQSMFVFPEGTRSKEEGTILPFHAGSFKIATKPKVPVVPITIVGMGDILEDHFPHMKRVPVAIRFDEPIETASMGREEIRDLPDRVRGLIVENYARMKQTLYT